MDETPEELRRRVNDVCDRVVGCAYAVANTLGVGFRRFAVASFTSPSGGG